MDENEEEKTLKNKKSNVLPVVIITLVISGTLGFFGGMKYQQGKTTARFAGFNNDRGQFMQRNGGPSGNGANFQPVNGEIINSEDTSITVRLQDGSSKIVLLSDSTSINKAESGLKEDLKTGEKVMVIGTSNSDGSVSAQSIQLNPPERIMIRQDNQ